MLFELFKWFIALLSLLGVVLNIRKKRSCFIWAGTNICWVLIDLYHGVWSQAALMAVYSGLAVWGIVDWRERT